MCMLLRRIFFTSGITDLCRSSSSSPWWALPLMSRLLVTQTAAQWLCEHHLNCHVGWVQILRVLGPRLPPRPQGAWGVPQQGRRSAEQICTQRLPSCVACAEPNPAHCSTRNRDWAGWKCFDILYILEDFSFNKLVLHVVPFFSTSWSPDFEQAHRTEHQFAWKSLQMWGSALRVSSLTFYSGNFFQM